MQEPKTIQINLKNNSLTQQYFYLFDVNGIFTPNPNVVVSGSTNYDFFVQTLNNDPKLIYSLLIKMPQFFLKNPINIIYTDANGESNTIPYLPNTDIDVYQKSSNRGSVIFEDGLVININTQIGIYLPPLITIILLIDYSEFIKSDFLDIIVRNEEKKAKYLITQSYNDGKIKGKRYWGSTSFPKEISLSKNWIKDLKNKFENVEILEYDTPKLSGGNYQIKEMFQNLFGFKKEVKKRFIGITENIESKDDNLKN